MSNELAEQTRNAFDFVQKLFFEISYLIKDIEGLLQREDEGFLILRPAGYGVTTRSSTGLEPVNVEQWLNKNFTVFYCPAAMTEIRGGQTVTEFRKDLRIIFLHIRVISREIKHPQVTFGYIKDIVCKKSDWKKFEHMAWEFAGNGEKIFKSIPDISYEDSYCSFNGRAKCHDLFDISSGEDVIDKIVAPVLELYRG